VFYFGRFGIPKDEEHQQGSFGSSSLFFIKKKQTHSEGVQIWGKWKCMCWPSMANSYYEHYLMNQREDSYGDAF
jgi:hypothetical protein